MINALFQQRFEIRPTVVVRAPGRINLIGEHTDYNNGWVLPAAIDKSLYFAFAQNGTKKVRIYSIDIAEYIEFPVDLLKKRTDASWSNYLMGIIQQFQNKGENISGFDCVFGGNIPIGAGMSSSAALDCGFASGICQLFDLSYTNLDLALLTQRSDHEFVGVKCGIMDQFASLFGREDHLVKLDCHSLEHEYVPINMKDFSIVLCDSGVSHTLASSEYNKRREECEEGVLFLKKYLTEIKSLRDVKLDDIEKYGHYLPTIIRQRCTYVVEENQRVNEMVIALKDNNFQKIAELMYASHEGLSQKYEVSCAELDYLAELTHSLDFVHGARMMGGGFGGCTVNIVENNKLDVFTKYMKENYYKKTNKKLAVYNCTIKNGVELLSSN